MTRYLLALSLAANQLVNALTGGSPSETVSSRLGHARLHHSRPAAVGCRVLEFLDVAKHVDNRDHCDKAIHNYVTRIESLGVRHD